MANTLNLGNGNWATKKDSLLAYNDENNNFKPLPFDFTRASSATVVNKQGLIETVGSGEPRIDFLGNTKGALKLEPQRTNLITQSESFPNPYWTKSGATIQGDPSTAGSELITNGDFATDSDWSKGTGWTISGGSLNASATTATSFQQNTGLVVGRTYKVTYTISNYVGGSVRIELGSANVSVGLIRSANGTYTEYIEALGDETIYFDGISAFTGSIDNVSVKEVQGFSSPDGTNNAYKLVENSANSSHYLRTNTSSANPSVISVFAKKGEETKIFIGNATFSQGVLFDLDLGVIESGSDGTIENYGNGWYKCSFYRTDLSAWQYISLRGNFTTYQGNGVNGVYLYGAQLEVGNYSTSLINTQGSAVTRLADVCINGGNEQVINSTEGVLYAEISALALAGGDSRLSLSDGTLNNRISFAYSPTASKSYIIVKINGVSVINNLNVEIGNHLDIKKIAISYKSGDTKVFLNGIELSIASSVSFSGGVLNDLSFGSANGSVKFLGNTKDVRVYNTALTDSELQQLTTI